jgi:uncharacterized sodium:solute symporter family permease YidK
MRRFKALFTVLLGLLLLFDGVTAFRVWWYGLKHVSMTNGSLSVESVPVTVTDWLILLLLAGLHAALICAVWKAWRSAPVRV